MTAQNSAPPRLDRFRQLLAALAMAAAPLMLGLVSLSPGSAMAQGASGIGVCKGALEPSLVNGCDGITDVGCCDVQGRALWCEGNDLYCLDCGDGFDFCGWSEFGYYSCGEAEDSMDPSGNFPATCGECPAECDGDAACSDACRGACGTCDDGVCLESGSCYVPDCDGKECGVDAMGFSCGSCGADEVCLDGLDICGTLSDQCVPSTEPGCVGCAAETCVCDAYPECCTEAWDIFCVNAAQSECGADCSGCPPEPSCDGIGCGEWCGLDCGGCSDGDTCIEYQCCSPQCDGKSCGDDGCGGSCGDCDGTDVCDSGQCVACQPDCEGKTCGADGCGGSCGECGVDEACLGGTCSASGCPGGLTFEGCCDGGETQWCDDGNVQSQDCGQQGCGWDSQNNWYFCGNDGEVDPSGTFNLACPGACQPECDGKVCGDNGCGGSCGQCPDFGSCQPDGSCAACVPACDGKTCGDDGCGGGCGDCADGEVCTDAGLCEVCTPDCEGKTCGDDGCGGQCGVCEGEGFNCVANTWCVAGCGGLTYEGCCSPEGNVYWCEDDELRGVDCSQQGGGGGGPGGGATSCGWSNNQGYYWCGAEGEDPSGTFALACDFGPCEADCDGKVCGSDGCGGSCGLCADDEVCDDAGACGVCQPDCDGSECGDDGCGGACGSCADGEQCVGGQCSEDGCGGVTFEGCCDGNEAAWCENGVLQGQTCEDGCGWVDQGGFYDCNGEGAEPSGEFPLACPGACAPDCDGKTCGDDGCGGDCGTCEDGVECSDAGLCQVCEPSCDGSECGDDGCGGICGICEGDAECISGTCREGCEGLDARGCCDGNTAVWCRDGELRTQNCGTATCGWLYGGNEHYDCGGEGPDPSGEVALECGFDCVTDCDGSECGDDGCGGVCGTCGDNQMCEAGSCVAAAVDEDPDVSGPDGIGSDDVTTIDAGTGGGSGGGCDCDAGPGVPSALWLVFALGGWLVSRRRRC